jgi:ribosomal subunit interface protein
MTNLPIHITAHHLVLNDVLRGFVFRKIGGLRRFADDALAAEIVLRRDRPAPVRFSAVARLSLPGRDIHARADSVNIHGAIHQLVVKLARLIRKRKTRFLKTISRAGNRPRWISFDAR